jgi:hypothetical protein
VEGPLKRERWRVPDVPDEEVHTFVNDLLRPVGTYYLYGRRMYETMVGWETIDTAAQAPFSRNFAHAEAGFSNDRSCNALARCNPTLLPDEFSRNLAEREGFYYRRCGKVRL